MKLLHLAHAAEGLEIVAINLFEGFAGFGDDGKHLKRFLSRHTPVFPTVTGTAKLFGDVKRLPTVFVFDRQGKRRLHFVHGAGTKKTNSGLSELRRAVRDSPGFGAAGRSPSLPERAESATQHLLLLHFAESTR